MLSNSLKVDLFKLTSLIVFLQMKRPTGDILQNLTGYNISDYLVKTYPQILKKRYYIIPQLLVLLMIIRVDLLFCCRLK